MMNNPQTEKVYKNFDHKQLLNIYANILKIYIYNPIGLCNGFMHNSSSSSDGANDIRGDHINCHTINPVAPYK